MKIGIDLDGVVIDSETNFRVYEEIFAIDDLNFRSVADYEEPEYQGRYNLSKEEQEEYNIKYLLKAAEESPIMVGFKPIFERMKKFNFEYVVITARGGFFDEMKDDAERLLKENNIKFDKYYWKVEDKVEICKKEKIDIMIDDNYQNIVALNKAKIKTLYFREPNMKKLKETKYNHEVNNWGDIYRYFSELLKNK